jgi:hypothetical protein
MLRGCFEADLGYFAVFFQLNFSHLRSRYCIVALVCFQDVFKRQLTVSS